MKTEGINLLLQTFSAFFDIILNNSFHKVPNKIDTYETIIW